MVRLVLLLLKLHPDRSPPAILACSATGSRCALANSTGPGLRGHAGAAHSSTDCPEYSKDPRDPMPGVGPEQIPICYAGVGGKPFGCAAILKDPSSRRDAGRQLLSFA